MDWLQGEIGGRTESASSPLPRPVRTTTTRGPLVPKPGAAGSQDRPRRAVLERLEREHRWQRAGRVDLGAYGTFLPGTLQGPARQHGRTG